MTDGCADLLGGESTHEPSMISPNFSDRMQRVHLLQRCIEIAEYAACPVLNLVSGRKRQDCTEKESMQRLEDSLSQLLTFCSETTLVIEPEPGMLIETTQQAKALIEKMRNPRLKMNIDLGHVKCSEPDYLSRIEKAIPYAAHCHLEDILGNVHHHLIPGEGDMDFQTIFRLMELHGYGGYLSVERYRSAVRNVPSKGSPDENRCLQGIAAAGNHWRNRRIPRCHPILQKISCCGKEAHHRASAL